MFFVKDGNSVEFLIICRGFLVVYLEVEANR